MIVRLAGSSLTVVASRVVQKPLGDRPSISGITGSLPVAMTMRSVRSSCSPTVTASPRAIAASPLYRSTPLPR